MNREEERNYVFAQLSSLPNAFQYVSVTNYIENLERENKKYKEIFEKALDFIDCHFKEMVADEEAQELKSILNEEE